MSTGLLERPMATKRNDVSTKIDADVLEDARRAAALMGMSLAEYLSETIRSAVERDVREGYKRWEQHRTTRPKR